MKARSLMVGGALVLSLFLAPALSMASSTSDAQSPVSIFLSAFISAKNQVAAVVASTPWSFRPLVLTAQKGQIPLTVSATARMQSTTSTCGATVVGSINWGDGLSESLVAERSSTECGKETSDTIQHTFTKAGVYSVTFTDLQKKTSTQVVQATTVVAPPVVAPKVDLKVNGSDGPVSLSSAQEVTLTWTSVGVSNCDIYVARANTPSRDTVAPSGSKKITVDPNVSPYVSFNCNTVSGGTALSDFVKITTVNPVSIKVISPNGGEKFEAGSGKGVSIRMIASNVPTGSTLTTAFVRQSDGHVFTFPSDNSCSSVRSGDNVCTGTLVRLTGYDMGPGIYKAVATILGSPVGEKDGPTLATDSSDANFELVAPTAKKSATISITASSVAVTPALSMAVKYENMPVAVGVNIINSAGTTVWTQELSAGGSGSTVVSFPSMLPDGYYRAQAFGTDGTVYATSAPYRFAATVVFKATTSSAQSISLTTGQSISDGGIRITLSSISTGTNGSPVAYFTISIVGGSSSVFSAAVGESSAGGFTDTASPTGAVVFKISSVTSRSVNILISAVEKG